MKDTGVFSGLEQAFCCSVPGFVIPSCESTMDLAWHLYEQGRFPEYAWVQADVQTRPRGRRGRVWVSGPGSLSVTMRLPDRAAAAGPLLSMAVALPLIQAMAELNVPAFVKWPNDILIHDRKTGGILIEEKQGVWMAGIGMNIQEAPESSSKEHFFHLPAGCLRHSGVIMKTFDIWECFLAKILDRFSVLTADPVAIVREVNAVLAWKNETVVLANSGGVDGPAIVLGVDLHGRLELRTKKGITSIRSGTIYPRVT